MKIDIIRAWKDGSYRASLSEEEQALLPENPVGQFTLTDEELKAVYGAQAQTGGVSSIGVGGCGNVSQGGSVCQSVGSGSSCNSQQGTNCQSSGGNCPSQGGNCPSQGRRCQVTVGGQANC